ncbi:MAG TPA: bifunctional DNA-formamidopyrimidine glycosylase/DNA-(apurinic or apyrimidinic site) lyase [Acidobacteriota bacterium]|nr:bifunctional DNA-formamidopyrimidine glycosylase/DNA-(apurinic or apyrimidinic site) lyase [Acidobacteriota bacterium]
MPELPEVETTVRGLRATITGKTIERVTLHAPPSSIVVSPSLGPVRFDSLLPGRTVRAVTRRGKNILVSLTGDITLWIHLKMTGRLTWVPAGTPPGRHDLVLFDFERDSSSNARMHLRFNDYRRFGRLRLFPDEELFKQKGLKELGPEPLEISAEQFVRLCHRRARMIKPALLDQSFIAGLGNIYADESLYHARIHPRRLITSVSRRKLMTLHGQIRRLLHKAIRLMGTSVDTYAGVDGQPGGFQRYLKVYGNEGEPCRSCGTTIVREKIGSRSASFCPRCQRLR